MNTIINALYIVLMTYLISQYNYYLGMAYLTYVSYGLYTGYAKQALISKYYEEYMWNKKDDEN